MFKTPDELHAWVKDNLGLDVPRESVCGHHSAPFDYLQHAYFEPTNDCVVWAPRGGGKTRLGAVATLLDLMHKPGVSIRIMGGSLEQSMKMWEHLLPDVQKQFPDLKLRDGCKKISLPEGGTAAVLPQSQRAVRGMRVQKLRCDEVELFKPPVWEAAQLTTRSDAGRRKKAEGVSGVVEAFSTLHESGGLMSQIVKHAEERGVPVFRWCILDVLAECPPERKCEGCELWKECQGRAKNDCHGFVSIEDAVRLKSRVSRETWETEMLCLRPSVHGRVFPHFVEEVHVRDEVETLLPVEDRGHPGVLSLAVDFGFANPFACLWVRRYGQGREAITHVIDEHIEKEMTIDQHLAIIQARNWPQAGSIYCDPAGTHPNDQTATTNVKLLGDAGYKVKTRATPIAEGIELMRLAIAPALGEPRLFVHSRCRKLIDALKSYKYPEPPKGESPLKDGTHDHPVDALRYYFVNHKPRGRVRGMMY